MHSNTMPKTIQAWIDKNPGMIDDYHMERDEWGSGDGYGPWSIWLYLKPGLTNNTETHMIHEATAKHFLEVAKSIETCNCDACKSTMKV